MSRYVWIGALLIVAVAGVVTYFALRPTHCDGLPREMGACSSDRPSYEGTTCLEVARDWGMHMDERVLEVINGPEARRGQARSSLLVDAEILVTQLANFHMRPSRMSAECSPEEFLEVGEAEFSAELREKVGDVMWDGNPVVDYQDWRERLKTYLPLIFGED